MGSGGRVNFYRRYIGDYLRDTRDLTYAEHGAYSLLMDHIYATEKPVKDFAEAVLFCHPRTEEERFALERVFTRFLRKTKHGNFVNRRASKEIKLARLRGKAAKKNGLQGGRPKTQQLMPPKPNGLTPHSPLPSKKIKDSTNTTSSQVHAIPALPNMRGASFLE